MKKTPVIWGVVIVLALAGYGVVWVPGYLNFKNLQNQCYQKIENRDNIIIAYFSANSDFWRIKTIVANLQSQPGVNSVSASSQNDQLQAFIQAHSDIKPGQIKSSAFYPYIRLGLNSSQNVVSMIYYINGQAEKYGAVVNNIKQTYGQFREQELKAISKLQNNPMGIRTIQDCLKF